MAEILRKAIKAYNFLFDDLADSRTKSWFLVAKPYQGLALLGLYLIFVLKWGPKWMKNRPPFNIDKLMIAYNIVQIFSCAYLFKNGLKVWTGKYKFLCEPVDSSDSEDAMNIAYLVYLYYLTKYLDLLDTVFFVLRKKFCQISFLHVYHHTGMVMLVWGANTYYPGGHGTFVGLVNSFVHCVMYSYYTLSIAFPQVKYSLTWKKFVTQIQIVQFFLLVVHVGSMIFILDCAYPRWTVLIFLPQNIFILALFFDFYIKTYIKKPKEKIAVKTKSDDPMENIEVCANKEIGDMQFLINQIDDSKSISRRVNRT